MQRLAGGGVDDLVDDNGDGRPGVWLGQPRAGPGQEQDYDAGGDEGSK
jgi:hypothetical protein